MTLTYLAPPLANQNQENVILNHSPDYSMNCAPLSVITIANHSDNNLIQT